MVADRSTPNFQRVGDILQRFAPIPHLTSDLKLLSGHNARTPTVTSLSFRSREPGLGSFRNQPTFHLSDSSKDMKHQLAARRRRIDSLSQRSELDVTFIELLGSQFNDLFTVDVVLPDGTRVNLVDESVNTTAWTPVTGIDLAGGDSTVGQSGWRVASASIEGVDFSGNGQLRIEVSDVGDSVFDSIALIDDIIVN